MLGRQVKIHGRENLLGRYRGERTRQVQVQGREDLLGRYRYRGERTYLAGKGTGERGSTRQVQVQGSED